MKDLFTPIYEIFFGIYNSEFELISDHLYNNGGYIKLGLIFTILPLLLWGVFYFAWRFPYGRFWHWLLWLVIICIVIIGVTYGTANSEIFASSNQELIDAIGDPDSGYELYANSLPLKYALINGFLSIIAGFIYSFILKQFSKIQMHLPF